MNTSNLSHTAPLVAVPSFSPSFAWLRTLLHRAKVFLAHAFRAEGSAFSPSVGISHNLSEMRLHFSKKGFHTPNQDWYGHR